MSHAKAANLLPHFAHFVVNHLNIDRFLSVKNKKQ